MDASDTSSDDNIDDSSSWDSLFSGCTDVSPDGPGLCGRPFGHSSRRPPALIDVSVRPARREGVPTHGMRHGAEANPYRTILPTPMSGGTGTGRAGPVRGQRGAGLTHGLRHAADALLQELAARTAHAFLNVQGTTLAGGGSGINPNWVLLDSQSTCNVFSNPRLLR